MILPLALAAALVGTQDEWPIGQEREVDEGVYMQVVAARDGWRVWRVEARGGAECLAIKAARGLSPPVPLGFRWVMSREAPALLIKRGPFGIGFTYSWQASYFEDVTAQYRLESERFWRYGDFRAAGIGEQPIEVNLTSYQYPAIRVGRAEDTGTIDLAGMSWAQGEVRQCRAVTQ